MNNLEKVFTVAIVIIVSAASAFFLVKANPELSESLSHRSKLVNGPIKAGTKKVTTPTQAIKILVDLGWPTRDYENESSQSEWGNYGTYEAYSDRFILESRDLDRFKNNLTWNVVGDADVAHAISIDMIVNDVSNSTKSIDELIKYSNELMYKVTGKNLTPEIKKAIQTKTAGEWIVNGYKIKLIEELLPPEKIIKGIESTSDKGAFTMTFLIEL